MLPNPVVVALKCIAICLATITVNLQADEIRYNADIRPVLSKHCFVCHGSDEGSRQAGFRIDLADEASDLLAPGKPEESEVLRRIASDDPDERMPPTDHGEPLSPDEIELIRKWISGGAKYQNHWSFVVPEKIAPPRPRMERWSYNEIDQFVAVKLQDVGLSPSQPEQPHRLIRRLALDLTGLPPTSTMVARFAESPSIETYQQIVDELMASPAYGEHWAAMWMDLARYADTIGYAEDKNRTIWPWRDWVIRAFNDNMPYDQFTIEQIAGDLLNDPTESQRLATAFHRNTLNNSEGGTSDEEFRIVAVKDRISTTVNVWMGLTIRCAECHSHKYDPITQREYYQFLDFFNQTADTDRNDDGPQMGLRPPGREAILKELDVQIDRQTKQLKQAKLEAGEPTSTEEKKRLEILQRQLDQLVKRRDAPVMVPILVELPMDQRRKTHVMIRGSYLQPGEQVTANVFRSFHKLAEGTPKDRLGIAIWLTSNDNPLTARVAVNRFWARLFGIGIVETEEDFGTQGTLPSNQELLDWMAVDFRDNGWNTKRLLKQMVMSATYRQSSRATPDRLAGDPRNVYLSRGPRVRLSAEVVRDQALAVSGLLSRKLYGPPVYPPNPVKRYVSAFTGGMNWNVSVGEDRYRRAIYTYLKRSSPHPLFETFDMATREVCNLRRINTNTPLQSFMTLNAESFIEAAQALARIIRDEHSNMRQRMAFGVQTALFRPAADQQIDTLAALYRRMVKHYTNNQQAARKMSGLDQSSDGQVAAELAALTVVSNVILNMDAFLTK